MIRIIEGVQERKSLFTRRKELVEGLSETVAAIIRDVRQRGDEALMDYTERFDGIRLARFEVTEAEMDAAVRGADAALVDALEMAANNIRMFHVKQLRRGFVMDERPGVVLGQKVTPIASVGLYVPGGTAAYPSTVLMNAIPAVIAGCPDVCITTPPGTGGSISQAVLLAAKTAGVHRVLKVGGAQAVAALAYGTESIRRVDKITGPGNAYVTEAKRQVFGDVGIDMVAGPSEIMIVADKQSNPAHLAADLLSQAEHDPLASAVLATDSRELADRVAQEIDRQLARLPRASVARASIENNGVIVVTKDISEAVDIANELAPEHLELCVDDPFGLLYSVKNAGSVFLGRYTPEAVGDYIAGTNHTLPTSGTARFSSPLSVDDFVKTTQFTYYSRGALERDAAAVCLLAEQEGLQAHAASVRIREEDI